MPTLNDLNQWREHAEKVAAGFDLKTARGAFVREYISRRMSETSVAHCHVLLRKLCGRIGAMSRRLAKFKTSERAIKNDRR